MGESVIMKYAKTLRLTAENTAEALRLMAKNYGVKIKMLAVDYLQIQPIEAVRMGRVEQVTEAIVGLREIGRALGCPVMQGAQAARSADAGGTEQIPALHEAQWASAIEQSSDEVFGAWRPITTRKDRGFKWKGQDIPTQWYHLLLRSLKDRWGASTGETWLLHFEPHKLILTDTEDTEP
jgi:replicative DNA helicase